MPNPCHMRDWTDSIKVNRLDACAERFFVRLMQKSDDHGRHPADSRLLKSRLFPLLDDVRITDCSRWLAACEMAGLVRCYLVADGRKFCEILNFGQRKKWMKSEHPPPEGQPALFDADETIGCGDRSRSRSRSRAETPNAPAQAGETEKNFPEAAIPTLAEVKTYAEMHGIPETSAQTFFAHHEDNALWLNQYQRLINWKTKLATWATHDRQPKPNHAHRRPSAPDRNAGTFNQPTAPDAIHRKIR